MTATTNNTYVHQADVEAVRGSAATVKAEILRLATAAFPTSAFRGSFELVHDAGSVFELAVLYRERVGGVSGVIVARMPLRRMLAWLRWRAR